MAGTGLDEPDSAATIRHLLEADLACGLSSGQPLPTLKAAVMLANDLRSLLFPQLWLASEGGSLEESARLVYRRAEAQLKQQIRIALEHEQSTGIRLHSGSQCDLQENVASLATKFLRLLPHLQILLQADIQAAFERDPAAKTSDEITACYPGIQAILIYRLAHALLETGVPYLPRILSEWAHGETGIDIHPGARIGASFFIDHGTGVVVGETCVIGSGVTLYQGVTLGAWSFPRDEEGRLIRGTQRHPTLEDGVTVYSNATVLGGTTVVGAGSLIGSSVTLSRSVPPNTIVTIEKPSLQFREAG
jgi:serine O-acetyltransferase